MARLGGQRPRNELVGRARPDWGPYAEATWLDLALRVLDELAHHGAEVGLLRDLYAQPDSLSGHAGGAHA